jgi:hypothetical protein
MVCIDIGFNISEAYQAGKVSSRSATYTLRKIPETKAGSSKSKSRIGHHGKSHEKEVLHGK